MDKLKLLFVDDEESVLDILVNIFNDSDFEVFVTTSIEEGLELIKNKDIAVVMSDQQMPLMNGSEFLEKVKVISPDSIRIVLSGHYSDTDIIEAINNGGVFRFLTKPFDVEKLHETINDAGQIFQAKRENIRLNTLINEKNILLKDLNDNLEKKVIEKTRSVIMLNERLHESFLALIHILAEFTELNCAQVGSHSKRTALLAREISAKLELSDEDIFDIELAAMMHDVGKVGIPVEILKKSKQELSIEELKVLRCHPERGERILSKIPELSKMASFVRHHHEKIDGTGYPDGLKNESIPLGARIIAVADSFDKTLNSKDVYENQTPESALIAIQKKQGSSFDERVINALKKYLLKENPQRENELEIKATDLEIGMKLSRDFRGSDGSLLLTKETVVEDYHLKNIKGLLERVAILDNIFIYRKK